MHHWYQASKTLYDRKHIGECIWYQDLDLKTKGSENFDNSTMPAIVNDLLSSATSKGLQGK